MKKILYTLLLLPILSFCQTSYSLTDSLQGYWPIDSNTNDFSGNNLHGIFQNETY